LDFFSDFYTDFKVSFWSYLKRDQPNQLSWKKKTVITNFSTSELTHMTSELDLRDKSPFDSMSEIDFRKKITLQNAQRLNQQSL
jgi:hypothetical protein